MAEQTETNDPEELPRILICGWGRCGKTSINKVVFHMMPSFECRYLEATQQTEQTTVDRNAVLRFEVVDIPGSTEFDDPSVIKEHFEKAGAVVIVIDFSDEPYTRPLAVAKKVIEQVHAVNKRVSFDIFIHKVEGDQSANHDSKAEIQRRFHGQLTEGFDGACEAQMQFHCTSIFDYTIYEAMSKVVRRLIPNQTPVLQQALTQLAKSSSMEKAYLFDIVSKVYIASDSQPVNLESYEFCADLIDVVTDTTLIYGDVEEPWPQKTAWGSGYDPKAFTTIQLANGRVLYIREVDKCLALVCIIPETHFDTQFLIDFNIGVFRETLIDIFKVPTIPVGST